MKLCTRKAFGHKGMTGGGKGDGNDTRAVEVSVTTESKSLMLEARHHHGYDQIISSKEALKR